MAHSDVVPETGIVKLEPGAYITPEESHCVPQPKNVYPARVGVVVGIATTAEGAEDIAAGTPVPPLPTKARPTELDGVAGKATSLHWAHSEAVPDAGIRYAEPAA